jgi:hypothetical protein
VCAKNEKPTPSPKAQNRAGFCRPGAAPCACIQQNKFVQLATANHGAPVHAVSWCCQPALNRSGHPSINLAIAGDPVPGGMGNPDILIRIYELDLVNEHFTEMNATNINQQIQGATPNTPAVNALDWCCSSSAYFLVAGGSNLAIYDTSTVADTVVFAFDNASWVVNSATPIPFAVGRTGYYYYTYGATVYAVAALCSPCTDSTIQFYLAIGGKSVKTGIRKEISIVTFVLAALA